MATKATTGRVNIPGLKVSTGMKSFDPLTPGKYTGSIAKLEIKPPKNNAPADVWNFTIDVLSGPPQDDGKAAKGRKAWHRVTIMHEEHPSYRVDQMGVDELKTMIIAAGIEIKGDTVNPDSFLGQEIGFTVVQTLDESSGKTYANLKAWTSV